jgi:hypothetical protein
MPLRNAARRKQYGRDWIRNRRDAWFRANGPCRKCGSWEDLELDHIDASQKVDHRLWSWSLARRTEELAKCQPLCHSCHESKTIEENRSQAQCGTRARYKTGCRCDACKRANREYFYSWLRRRPAKELTPRQVAQLLSLQQAERDRELTAINIALKSGTAAKVYGG